ncbi:MAG: YciK family oxidoreductase [bacterium]
MSNFKDYNAPSDLLKDRVILVTGAGDGIGRQAAKAYAAHGATVVLLGKTIPKLEEVYDEIQEDGGPEPAIYPLHMEGASPDDYAALAATLKEQLGRLDGILHNAAKLPYLSRISDYDNEDWLKVMQVNVNAPFMITQACLPLLMDAPDSAVIFTSDNIGHKEEAFWGAYDVSKAGQEKLMRVLAGELDNSPVRVNSIDPGPTHTRLRRNIFPGEDPATLKLPVELMPLYLWLMGPDSQGEQGNLFTWE